MLLVVTPALCCMDRTRDKGGYLGYCGGDGLMLCEVSRKAAVNHPNVKHGSVVHCCEDTKKKVERINVRREELKIFCAL